nr:hypothetical protein [Jiangella sp. DSM 45060]
MGVVIGRGHPIGLAFPGPARTAGWAETERAEFVEREGPVREVLQDVLDAVELGIPFGVGGLLPGLRALKRDPAAGEQATQGFPADPDRSASCGGQEGGEFTE